MTTPKGYTAAAMSGDNVIELTCDQCAASVAVLAAARHSDWHREIVTKRGLAGALDIDADQVAGDIAELLQAVARDLGHDPGEEQVRGVLYRRLEEAAGRR